MKRRIVVYLATVVFLAFATGAFAQPLPPAGSDTFDSIAHIRLELGQPGAPAMMLDVDAVGPTTVQRGSPAGGAIPTEMRSMDLSGFAVDSQGGLHDIMVRESPTKQSLGKVTGTLRKGADSFFDIFVDISITPEGGDAMMLHNEQPARLQATGIKALPPIEIAYRPPQLVRIPLFNANGQPAGFLIHVQHVPCWPSACKIKREVIKLERKLDKLLRAHGIPPGP
jgi:hypothetical protein